SRFVDVFFFQAEDGIRDRTVTGVQTCALPICNIAIRVHRGASHPAMIGVGGEGSLLINYKRTSWQIPTQFVIADPRMVVPRVYRSEERRVGKEWTYRWSP